MRPPSGRCYWAVAPFAPQPPYRLYAGEAQAPKQVPRPGQMTAAARHGMSEFTMLVPVKSRPVLVISEMLTPYDEVLALRLRRLEKLSAVDADQVRKQEDEALFFLDPGAFPGLPTENAVIITSRLRLPVTSVDTREELGALNLNELRVAHERVARSCGLILDSLVRAQALELIQQISKRK